MYLFADLFLIRIQSGNKLLYLRFITFMKFEFHPLSSTPRLWPFLILFWKFWMCSLVFCYSVSGLEKIQYTYLYLSLLRNSNFTATRDYEYFFFFSNRFEIIRWFFFIPLRSGNKLVYLHFITPRVHINISKFFSSIFAGGFFYSWENFSISLSITITKFEFHPVFFRPEIMNLPNSFLTALNVFAVFFWFLFVPTPGWNGCKQVSMSPFSDLYEIWISPLISWPEIMNPSNSFLTVFECKYSLMFLLFVSELENKLVYLHFIAFTESEFQSFSFDPRL